MPTPRPGQHWQSKVSGNVVVIKKIFACDVFYTTTNAEVNSGAMSFDKLLTDYRQMSSREIAAYGLFGITDIGTVSDAEDEAIDQRMREDAQSDACE